MLHIIVLVLGEEKTESDLGKITRAMCQRLLDEHSLATPMGPAYAEWETRPPLVQKKLTF